MTAAQRQTIRVYIGDFTKCATRHTFYRAAARAFGLGNLSLPASSLVPLPINRREFFTSLCRRFTAVANGYLPVRVRLIGLENIYVSCPEEVTTLIRILRALEEKFPNFRAEIRIGNAVWNASRQL